MAEEKRAYLHWFAGIFEPTVDFYDLLNKQADKTLEGVQALASWLKAGGNDRGQQVRDLEKEADDMKLELAARLEKSFVTPIDREDILELSATMDEVINSAKNVVREMDALAVTAEGTRLVEMADILVEGTTNMRNSIYALKKDLPAARDQASLARKSETRLQKVYRASMQQLLETDDFKAIIRTREVYKAMAEGAEKINRVGEKLLHAIVKI
jgi:uncharacterized protein